MAMVFVSYSGRDGEEAAAMLQEKFGKNTFFVAHRSIEAGEEWEKTIWKNLRAAPLFAFVVTNEYNESHYAQQELGAAMALRKDIVPLLGNGITPEDIPGFAKKYQAMALSPGKGAEKGVEAVLGKIAKQQKEKERKKRKARQSKAPEGKRQQKEVRQVVEVQPLTMAQQQEEKRKQEAAQKEKSNKDALIVGGGLLLLLAFLSSRS